MKNKRIAYVFFIIGLLIVLSLPFMGLIQSFNHEREVTLFSKEENIYKTQPDFVENIKVSYEEKNKEDITDPFVVSTKETTKTEVVKTNTAEGEYTHDLINGSVGHIEMPTINEKKLPLYIGASKENLAKGVAQVTGTSLPMSGKGSHSVLSAHRGYYGSNLFMYIDYLEIGDVFYVTYLDKTQAYEVTGNEIIEASDVDKLIEKPDGDEEWLTLLTCHPLPTLEKRLLVHSKRVPLVTTEEQLVSDSKDIVTTNVGAGNKKEHITTSQKEMMQTKYKQGEKEVIPSQPVVVFISKTLQHAKLVYITVLSIGALLLVLLVYKFIKTFSKH